MPWRQPGPPVRRSDAAMLRLSAYSASKHAVKDFDDANRRAVLVADPSITLVKPSRIGTAVPQHARNKFDSRASIPALRPRRSLQTRSSTPPRGRGARRRGRRQPAPTDPAFAVPAVNGPHPAPYRQCLAHPTRLPGPTTRAPRRPSVRALPLRARHAARPVHGGLKALQEEHGRALSDGPNGSGRCAIPPPPLKALRFCHRECAGSSGRTR